MKRIEKRAVCIMAVLFISLVFCHVGMVFGDDNSQPRIMPTPSELGNNVAQFQAAISKDTIKVGESAIITFKGKQLDVAGGNIIDNIGTEFASIVKLTQVDKIKYKVTGLAPGEAVLKFKNGENEVEVKVVVGGLN